MCLLSHVVAATKCIKKNKGAHRVARWGWFRKVPLLVVSLILITANAYSNDSISFFDIPQQRADSALSALGQQANVSVVFRFDAVSKFHTNTLRGRYTLPRAVGLLLAGTGLSAEMDEGGSLVILEDNNQGNEMNSKKNILAAVIGGVLSGGVVAQDDGGDELGWLLEEVVVTAERRSASMQDVPISITAFSGETLNHSGVRDTFDLEMVTPGLSISTDTIQPRIFIRGIGSRLTGPGTDPSISTYVDGVYQVQTISSLVDVLDVERVEVLKGPQGTLYGRNSTGGAIKYISRKPSEEFGGSLNTEVGDYNSIKVSAIVDVPLVEDKLLLRAAILKHDRDGYTEVINQSGPDIDREDLAVGRLTLQYTPNEDLDVLLHVAAINNDGDGAAVKAFIDPNDPGAALSSALMIEDPRKVAVNMYPQERSVRSRSSDATITWDMGSIKLASITGYVDLSSGPWLQDIDATELSIWAQGRMAMGDEQAFDGLIIESETFTQEVTLSSVLSQENKFSWTLGMFYLNGENFMLSGFDVAQFDFFASYRAKANVEAYAGFGDLSYSFTDKLQINAGIRYSSETKGYSVRNVSVAPSGPIDAPFETEKKSWNDWTPKVGMNYFISDDSMVYFTISEGFKSGVFEFSGTRSGDPEYITAYEIGAKTEWVDNRLRINVSAFSYDYKDLQVLSAEVVEGRGIVDALNNAAEANIQGVEIAATALLSRAFQVDVGLSWLDTEYNEFLRRNPADPSDSVDVSGNELVLAPEFTANVAITYNHQINNVGNLQAQINYYYSAEKHFNEFNDRAKQDNYEIINARIGFYSHDEVWNIALFGKNLTDELIFSTASESSSSAGKNGLRAELAPPRTYGLALAYKF